MIIKGFKTNEKQSKITSYYFELDNKHMMLDYGALIKNKDLISKIDFIFISHEHLDHTYGLFKEAKYLKDDCVIVSTRTTKRLLIELAKRKEEESSDKEILLNKLECIIELVYDKEYTIKDLNITLYQAGHTYGSSMIYIKSSLNIFYTGDINYQASISCLEYYLTSKLDVDYLIIDGTNILKDDYKKTSLTHVRKNAIEIDKFTMHARAEKAVIIGLYLAKEFEKIDLNKPIIFDKDLEWYLNILFEEGYDPTLNSSIDINYDDKLNDCDYGVFISNEDFQNHSKDYNIGLHISNSDYDDFFKYFNAKKIILGHYDLSDYDTISEEYSLYYVIKEGDNNIE